MVENRREKRAYRMAVGGYALALPGALLAGLFVFFHGFASGWGRDSIGAGIVMGIFAPAVFLGTTAVLTILSACAIWPHSKNSCVGLFGTTLGVAVLSLLIYFSSFIPMVNEATGSARAWQGHSLPSWWDTASLSIVSLSMIFILSSLGLSVFSLRINRKEARETLQR